MCYFDCNCRAGFETVPVVKFSRTTGELLREMDFFDINKALVMDSETFYDRPTPRPIRSDRLLPVLNFLPYRNVQELSRENLKQTICEGRYAAIRFQPLKGRYGLDAELFHEELLLFEQMRLPMLLDLNVPGQEYFLDYGAVQRFLQGVPELPVILMNTSYRIDLSLYPLMEQFPKLCVETSGYQGYHAIEELVERFGSRRIVFGSRYPFYYPGASRCRVETAELSEQDRKRIAYQNLQEMVEAVRYD